MASNERLLFVGLLLMILIVRAFSKSGLVAPTVNATGVIGSGVDLKCKVKLQECGNFFSIEWYRDFLSIPNHGQGGEPELVAHKFSHRQRRHHHHHHSDEMKPRQRRETSEEEEGRPTVETERVYVYRHHSGLSKSEGLWEGRASHQYDTRRHIMTVRYHNILF